MAAGHSVNVAGWRRVTGLVFDCFAGRFGRVEPRLAAAGFVTGMLADLQDPDRCEGGADGVDGGLMYRVDQLADLLIPPPG